MKRMNDLVEYYVNDQEFMGSVLVARNDDILLNKGYGFANLEWQIPNTSTTKYRLGSLTKQFTAAAVLLLEERGLLNTEDLIAKHMPNAPAIWKNIKIFNLLNHTHGIPNYTQLPEFRAITSFKKTPLEQIQLFINKSLDFEPGTQYVYNNSGYVLLGYLIELLSGQTYEGFIQENIFSPLGMNNSGYDSHIEVISHRASGYTKEVDGHVTNADYLDMSLPYSAGSLYSTTEDLLKWTQGLFGGKLLSQASLQKMTAPFKEHYGFGVEVKEIDEIKVIMHIGGINGFHTALIYSPETKTTIAVLSNLNTFGYVWDIGFLAQNIALKLLLVMNGREVKLSREKNPIEVAVKYFDQCVGEYKIKENLNLIVTVNKAQLEAHFSNQPIMLLFAEKELAFYAVVPDLEFKFLKNTAGQVTHVHLSQSGYELIGVKL